VSAVDESGLPESRDDGSSRGRAGTIFRNFSSLALGKVLGDACTFLFFVVVSREFGREGIGLYSFAIAFTAFFAAFAEFGLYQLTVREVSRRRSETATYFGGVLTLRLWLTLATAGVLAAVTVAALPRDRWATVLLIGAFQLLNKLYDGFAAVYVAHERMTVAGVLEFTLRSGTAVAGLLVIASGGGLLAALAMLPLANLIQSGVGYLLVRRDFGVPRLQPSIPALRALARNAAPYTLSSILYPLTQRTDVVVLGLLLTASDAGVYNVAYRIIYLTFFLPYFGGLAVFPIASRLYPHALSDLRQLYQRSMRVTVLLAIPVAAGVWLVAPELVPLLFGPEFRDSVMVLRMLSPLLVLAAFEVIVGPFLTAIDRQAQRTRAEWAAAAVNVICNLALVPAFGMHGSAVAALGSETVMVALFLWFGRDVLGSSLPWSRIAVATVGVTAFLVPLAWWHPLPLWAEVPLATLTYIAVLALVPAIRADEGRLAVRMAFGAAGRSHVPSHSARIAGGSRPAAASNPAGPLDDAQPPQR
jgi:O-antigen/teichoic acid export membrane protein